jgi:hypothetical protein
MIVIIVVCGAGLSKPKQHGRFKGNIAKLETFHEGNLTSRRNLFEM